MFLQMPSSYNCATCDPSMLIHLQKGNVESRVFANVYGVFQVSEAAKQGTARARLARGEPSKSRFGGDERFCVSVHMLESRVVSVEGSGTRTVRRWVRLCQYAYCT